MTKPVVVQSEDAPGLLHVDTNAWQKGPLPEHEEDGTVNPHDGRGPLRPTDDQAQ